MKEAHLSTRAINKLVTSRKSFKETVLRTQVGRVPRINIHPILNLDLGPTAIQKPYHYNRLIGFLLKS